jgi:transposase
MTNVLYRLTGGDRTPIDGLGGHLALGSIAEIGTDMPPWASEKHLASWLCLAPGKHQSGGKHTRSKTGPRPRTNRAHQLLRLAAMSLSRADRALGAFYRRRRGRLGAPKAITATAHKLAKIVYNRLTHGKAYVDRGAQYYDQPYRQRAVKHFRRRAEA